MANAINKEKKKKNPVHFRQKQKTNQFMAIAINIGAVKKQNKTNPIHLR